MQFSTAQSSLSLLHVGFFFFFFFTLSLLSVFPLCLSSSAPLSPLPHQRFPIHSLCFLTFSSSSWQEHVTFIFPSPISPDTPLFSPSFGFNYRCSETGALLNNEPKYRFVIDAQHLMLSSLPVRLSVTWWKYRVERVLIWCVNSHLSLKHTDRFSSSMFWCAFKVWVPKNSYSSA